MNAIALLFALLIVAFIGGSLSLTRGVRGYSLPSGVEYLLLGAALGPSALGAVDRATLSSMAPVFVFALGWIALGQGAESGFVGARRVRFARVLIGCALCALLALVIAVAVFLALASVDGVSGQERIVASVGVALVTCESTRHALYWVTEKDAAHGPLSQLISDVASADAAVPLVGLAWWFAARGHDAGSPRAALAASSLMFVALTLGAVLGVLAVALLKTTERAVDAWGVLLGAALIGVGVAHGSGLSWMTTLFAMGAMISLFRGPRDDVRASLGKTEHPVLLPILALAGAHIDVQSIALFAPILPVACVARAFFTVVVGALARLWSPTAALGGPWLGLSMMSSGALTLCVGFACALHAPGGVGQMILVAAVVDTVVGEAVGPIALRRALRHAGETGR